MKTTANACFQNSLFFAKLEVSSLGVQPDTPRRREAAERKEGRKNRGKSSVILVHCVTVVGESGCP